MGFGVNLLAGMNEKTCFFSFFFDSTWTYMVKSFSFCALCLFVSFGVVLMMMMSMFFVRVLSIHSRTLKQMT